MKSIEVVSIFVAVTMSILIDGYDCKVVKFLFGDSITDVGNNVYLTGSIARPNLPWYGIDLGNGWPNGRFTNGRTVADILGDMNGFPMPPAYLDPSVTEDIILEKGVNYASAGGGILNETGLHFVQRLPFYMQIELFQETQNRIRAKLGNKEAGIFFQEALYGVALGSNDLINNYFIPIYKNSLMYNDETFTIHLIDTLREQLKRPHSLGARQIFLIGLGPLGCIPLQRNLNLNVSGDCQERTNKMALSFNKEASELATELSTYLPDSSILYGDTYDLADDLMKNPIKYGFTSSSSPCCSKGKLSPFLRCIPSSSLCKNRSNYVFFDKFHPSDSANEWMASEINKKLGFLQLVSASPAPLPSITPSPDQE
ncbi:hypothetical protein Leryth_003740 [Lithospermum erythrorhizon]|nr:hypothetical protein Leryth_003740 [Lithospermum erythrorhizon]